MTDLDKQSTPRLFKSKQLQSNSSLAQSNSMRRNSRSTSSRSSTPHSAPVNPSKYIPSSYEGVKNTSISTIAVLKDSVKAISQSNPEASSQLKVLCSKFSALTEKIKEETKLRDAAEKEVDRLTKLLQDIESTRAISEISQDYVNDSFNSFSSISLDLENEKKKNQTLLMQAIQLEKEKRDIRELYEEELKQNRKMQGNEKSNLLWEKQQSQRLQSTLQKTIEDLEGELNRSQLQEHSLREELQIEKIKFEKITQEHSQLKDQSQQQFLELISLRKQNEQQKQTIKNTQNQAVEMKSMQEEFEKQLKTLESVNNALEQRVEMLVRRQGRQEENVKDTDTLRSRNKDLEAENMKLDTNLHHMVVEHKEEKRKLQERFDALQRTHCNEVTQLKQQNALYCELLALRSSTDPVPCKNSDENFSFTKGKQNEIDKPRDAHRLLFTKRPTESSCSDVIKLVEKVDDSETYFPDSSISSFIHKRPSEISIPTQMEFKQQNTSPSSISICSSATSCSQTSSLRTYETHGSDHNRLRLLMKRNKLLEERLLLESNATKQLENEISNLTAESASAAQVTSLQDTERHSSHTI